MYTGDKARELLGMSIGKTEKVRSLSNMSKYNCFIQSTSNNRKLLQGTKFLYEVI